ncbi:aminoglycoside phosphotransferase family protein [Rhodobacter lacus]|uniref:Aminoglycoside phosphotransferase family protein n=1 Tax=Rhodobacter lacus TaxID=1641972 RepID=A0ABW5A555_9RHOB
MGALELFLAAEGWGDAARAPLAGDASARRYERLTRGRETAVLMIAPPGEEFKRFLRVDAWLLAQGFSAPQVLAAAPEAGLMLLEDFGDAVLARLMAHQPEDQPALYGAITDFLIALHACPAPDFVAPLNGPALADLVGLVPQWYPCADPAAAADLAPLIAALHAKTEPFSPVMCLRDFHAENVIWLPDRAGPARLGLLDFQDAVAADPAYDLVSALQDARRDVPEAIERQERARYAALRGFDPEGFGASYALLGAQRALRILAIFARLCLAGGKPHYLALMPRVWGYLQRNLAAPSLAPLRHAVAAALVPPSPELLARMERECGQHPMR